MVGPLTKGDVHDQDRRGWKGGVTPAGRAVVGAIALAEEGHGVRGHVTIGSGGRCREGVLAPAGAILPVVGGRAVRTNQWPCFNQPVEAA